MTRPKRSPTLERLCPALAAAAQAVYDEWDEGDDDLGGGGICDLIADAFVDVLAQHDIEAVTMQAQHGENHIFTIAQAPEGVFEVDIAPSVYETGGGYTWQKIPDIAIEAGDVDLSMIDADRDAFVEYTDGDE